MFRLPPRFTRTDPRFPYTTLCRSATYTYIGKPVPTFGAHEVFDYHQTDLQLSVANPGISWLPEVALIVNNLTDERGITNAFTSGVPTPALAAEEYYYITPRAISLRLMGRFGD